jgi:hypothetical protein
MVIRRKRTNGRTLNKPYRYRGKGRYKMSVRVRTKSGRVKTINFGHRGYRHNYSKKARINYCKRSAGIRGKRGLTKNKRTSANYWARRILWKC